jgi:hypothetical protein
MDHLKAQQLPLKFRKKAIKKDKEETPEEKAKREAKEQEAKERKEQAAAARDLSRKAKKAGLALV